MSSVGAKMAMTICDLCEEHKFRLQKKMSGKLYCVLMDNFGPMNGQYRVWENDVEDIYDDFPPYRCMAEDKSLDCDSFMVPIL